MKRILLPLTAALAVFAFNPTSAHDQEPPPPTDPVAIADEPAGANCEAGGVSITDTSSGDVFYVCDGLAGADGADGADGNDGFDGQDGQDGQDGLDGMDGIDGGSGGTAAAVKCASARILFPHVPSRFHGRVTVTVNGARKHVHVKNHVIRVDASRLACGYYPVLVQRHGARSLTFVLRLRPGGISQTAV